MIENNAVYDAVGYGYNFNGYGHKLAAAGGHTQFESFKGNEVAGSRGGIWLTWSQGEFDLANYQPQVFQDTLVWHVRQDGLHSYHEANGVFNNLTIVGDPDASNRNQGSAFNYAFRSTIGVFQAVGSYENWNMTFDGLDISGVNVAIAAADNEGTRGTLLKLSLIHI